MFCYVATEILQRISKDEIYEQKLHFLFNISTDGEKRVLRGMNNFLQIPSSGNHKSQETLIMFQLHENTGQDSTKVQ